MLTIQGSSVRPLSGTVLTTSRLRPSTAPPSRRIVIRKAAETEVQDTVPANAARHVVPWIEDKETFQELLAFAGPAPERINGRIAMWGFAAAAAAELVSHKSVLQQLAAAPVGVIFTTLLITVGSLMPKFAAGVSLQELQDTCSREGLPPALRFFNKTHEIWIDVKLMFPFKQFLPEACAWHVRGMAVQYKVGQKGEEGGAIGGAGRVAMVGFLGLVAVELVLGRALFS